MNYFNNRKSYRFFFCLQIIHSGLLVQCISNSVKQSEVPVYLPAGTKKNCGGSAYVGARLPAGYAGPTDRVLGRHSFPRSVIVCDEFLHNVAHC